MITFQVWVHKHMGEFAVRPEGGQPTVLFGSSPSVGVSAIDTEPSGKQMKPGWRGNTGAWALSSDS